jgi:Fe2+ or Zn2+ uptake regulation protein
MPSKLSLYLKQSGYSVTAPRLAVFEYLAANDPTTVEAVIDYALDFNRASIYRSLALFRRLGVIQDIVASGRRMIELTDAFDTHHHHLSCQVCGALASIEDAAIERRLDQIARARGYQPVRHQIEVSGICAQCQVSRPV